MQVSMCHIILRVGCTNKWSKCLQKSLQVHQEHPPGRNMMYWLIKVLFYPLYACLLAGFTGGCLGHVGSQFVLGYMQCENTTSKGQNWIVYFPFKDLRELSLFYFMCIIILIMESQSVCHVSMWQGITLTLPVDLGMLDFVVDTSVTLQRQVNMESGITNLVTLNHITQS